MAGSGLQLPHPWLDAEPTPELKNLPPEMQKLYAELRKTQERFNESLTAIQGNFEKVALAFPNVVSIVSEKWHEVGASGEPAFQNSWVNFGDVYATAAFYKDAFGRVHLRGFVKSGTINTIFTLLAGYRPGARLFFAVESGSSVGGVTVDPNGGVVMQFGNTASLSLDGISFRAA